MERLTFEDCFLVIEKSNLVANETVRIANLAKDEIVSKANLVKNELENFGNELLKSLEGIVGGLLGGIGGGGGPNKQQQPIEDYTIYLVAAGVGVTGLLILNSK